MNVGSYNCCDTTSKEFSYISNLASLMKLVSEESRLRIICLIEKQEHCVCEIMAHTQMSQSLISHHLRDLKKEKLVTSQKKGVRVYYSLTEKGQEVASKLLSLKEVL